MDINYKEEFRKDIKIFREMTEKFYNQEITMQEYKGISGEFGSYAQRGQKSSMLRLRLTGGQLTKRQLQFIVNSMETFQIPLAHLTTCQSLQLHHLNKETVCTLIETALDYDIITRGGGGDFPRNVMVSPLSGVEQNEYFDVLPYANIAANYLLGLIKTVKLPRKLKVGFSNSPENNTHATFRDLGFVANADNTFDVYSAGGLGNQFKMGVLVASHIQPEQICYYIKAMILMFTTYGNYENRGKARTRYMQDSLGKDEYIKQFQNKVSEVFSLAENLDITVAPNVRVKTENASTFSHPRAIPQKQTGLFAVQYHPLGGNLDTATLRTLYEAIKNMEHVEIRIAPSEELYFIHCNEQEAQELIALTLDGAKTLFETSVACIGNTICQVGLRDSQGLLFNIIKEVQKHTFDNNVLPRIYISGCPSSCGTHQIGALGLRGSVKQVDGIPKPAFTLFVNGCDLQGKERFADEIGTILEIDIPHFIVELGTMITNAHTTFEEWYHTDPTSFHTLASKYIR